MFHVLEHLYDPAVYLRAAHELLRPDGRLFLYGPFKRDGKHTALSNAVFDTSLRQLRRPPVVRARDELSIRNFFRKPATS